MNTLEHVRREMRKLLCERERQPDPAFSITRRTFVRRTLATGAIAGAAAGWLPLINVLDVAVAAASKPFRFAWISDTHLYPKEVNERFVDKTTRAVTDVNAMDPPADFLIFGGDLAQLGDPVELRLGNEILKELKVKKVMIPGEHDWYLDMGKVWKDLFGEPNWTFDHKGVRFVGLDTISRAPDYWSATKMTPEERMGHMSVLDGTVAGAWAGVGAEQRKWLQDTLAGWPKDQPVVIISHNPLYEYYPPWNFWIRDWREVQEIVAPFTNVTNLHGHTHQPLYNEIGSMRSIGMLATSWPWPYAPEGVPKLTQPMLRVDPGDHFDGVGWSDLTWGEARVENRYVIWPRKPENILANARHDSGTGDNATQIVHSRIADRMWPYAE
jgi:predicted MPP superfamily phosphohydrolase